MEHHTRENGSDGEVLKSIGEWKEGKKFGFFEDVVRVSKQVYYDIDEVKSDSKVKREAPSVEDTDNNAAPPRRSKRRNVSMSPP